MMDVLGIAVSGTMLGAAGSMHCGAMCGCIASGALFMLAPPTAHERAVALAKMHAGRLVFYSLLGALSAGSTSAALGPSATEIQFRVLQWASAAAVMWIGLSMANVMPGFAIVDRIAVIKARLSPRPAFMHSGTSPWVMGALWGLAPCPLVYAAAFSAALTGSALNGALFMAAYGAGTLPSVTLTALGVTRLQSLRSNQYAHVGGGLAVAGFGLFVALSEAPLSSAFCAASP
jgi:sulfite exporter TauE/SafE